MKHIYYLVYFDIYVYTVYTINVYIHKVIQMPLSRRLVSLQGGLLQRQKWSDEQSAERGCHHPPKQSRCESLSVTKQIQTARVCLDVSRLCSMASNGKYMSKRLQHKIWNKDVQSKYLLSAGCAATEKCQRCVVLSGLLVVPPPLVSPWGREDLLRASKGQCAALPARCGKNFVTKSSSPLQEMQWKKAQQCCSFWRESKKQHPHDSMWKYDSGILHTLVLFLFDSAHL